MIGREVQEKSDVRAKFLDEFELKLLSSATLGYGVVFISSTQEMSGVPTYSRKEGGMAALLQNVMNERRWSSSSRSTR